MSPLSLTYAQLYHGDLSSRYKKKSQSQTSLLPPLNNNNKRNSFSNRRSNVNQAPPTNNPDKYIRLPIAQLRRLHVSSKYIKRSQEIIFLMRQRKFLYHDMRLLKWFNRKYDVFFLAACYLCRFISFDIRFRKRKNTE